MKQKFYWNLKGGYEEGTFTMNLHIIIENFLGDNICHNFGVVNCKW